MRAFLAGLLSLGQAAWAGCPTGADLAQGVRVTYDPAGEYEVFTRIGDALVQSDYTTTDGSTWRAVLVHGAYMILNQELTDGALVPQGRETYAYALKPQDFPVPAPDLTWDVTIVENSSRGLLRRDLDYTFGPLRPVTLGACSYEAFEMTFPFDEGLRFVLLYLPALGISVIAGEIKDGVRDDFKIHAIDAEAAQ